MIKNQDSLKMIIKNISKELNVSSRILIQNYMFERFLRRVSISKYYNNFIFKGGMIISSIFGISNRSTYDIDASIKGLPLEENALKDIISNIANIDMNDDIVFELISIKSIREDDIYGGYNINLKAHYKKLWEHIMIDVTTGDIITQREIRYKYKSIFDSDSIDIYSYNYETIIAEKYEAILSKSIENTRMKDYYDIYMFVKFKWNDINKTILKEAIKNTSNKRETTQYINNSGFYIDVIKENYVLKKLWEEYKNKYDYAKDIDYNEIIEMLRMINKI